MAGTWQEIYRNEFTSGSVTSIGPVKSSNAIAAISSGVLILQRSSSGLEAPLYWKTYRTLGTRPSKEVSVKLGNDVVSAGNYPGFSITIGGQADTGTTSVLSRNSYMLHWGGTSSGFSLLKVDANLQVQTLKSVNNVGGYNALNGGTVRFRRHNGVLTAYLNDVVILTHEENSFSSDIDEVGITGFVYGSAGEGAVMRFDNFVVREYIPDPSPPIPATFEASHTSVELGQISSVSYNASYSDEVSRLANVKIYDGAVGGELIADVNVASGVRIPLAYPVEVGDVISVVVTTTHEIQDGSWSIDFFEAQDDNNWTFLGYADDQLVGMTANQQLWNGPIDNPSLSNAKLIPNPSPILLSGGITTGGSGLTISGSSTSNEPYRISVTYTLINRFGPTKPAPLTTFYASKPSSEWSTSSYIKLSGTAPNASGTPPVTAGVLAVELYFTEGESQEIAFLGRVSLPDLPAVAPSVIPPTTKPWSFNWTGYQLDTSSWLAANLTIPNDNYTMGVPASKMAVIDGRLYFWGNTLYPYRIWVGGVPGSRFSISPGTGGGFVDVDPGSGTAVTGVLKFKTQQGAAIVTALTDNPNSQKVARYNLVESNISLSNEQSSKSWMAEKIAGAVGCKSERGSVAAGDGLYTISRYGLAITTLTMEYNSQLQVMYVSDPISPVFLKQYGEQLKMAVLHEINGTLYMMFGAPDGSLDNVIFCYDIALKAWWTYTLDSEEPILNMIHIDHEGHREGLGIITESGVYLLPTTIDNDLDEIPTHEVLIESGELSTIQPLQAMHNLTQLEFRFDYFIGDLDIIVKVVDQFGRTITTTKKVKHYELQHQLSERIRIDQVVESYQITLRGRAKMRMTNFTARLYPKPARIGMVYGFDSSQRNGSSGIIRRVFNSYNDLKKAIIP